MNNINILCNIEEIIQFSENQDVTPNDHRLTFDPINVTEGLKVMNVYELHE